MDNLDFKNEVNNRFTSSDIDRIREFVLSGPVDAEKFLGAELAEKVFKFYLEVELQADEN